EASRRFGSLLEDEPAPPLDFSDLRAKYERRAIQLGPSEGPKPPAKGPDGASPAGPRAEVGSVSPSGRFSSAPKHLSLLLIEAGGFSTGAAQSRALLGRVKADIAALGGPDHYAPGMRLGFSGEV